MLLCVASYQTPSARAYKLCTKRLTAHGEPSSDVEEEG